MKERLVDYKSGKYQKLDSRGRDVTKYEIEDLQNKIAATEAALKRSGNA